MDVLADILLIAPNPRIEKIKTHLEVLKWMTDNLNRNNPLGTGFGKNSLSNHNQNYGAPQHQVKIDFSHFDGTHPA